MNTIPENINPKMRPITESINRLIAPLDTIVSLKRITSVELADLANVIRCLIFICDELPDASDEKAALEKYIYTINKRIEAR